MRLVFFGAPEFAGVILGSLIYHGGHEIAAVITKADMPKGRGKALAKTPVKMLAEEHNIPIMQPKSLKRDKIMGELSALGADVFVVAAYGLILPEGVLNIPKYGSINVHGSILPQYRGASPIHHALLNGDKKTGVTIIQMDKGIDTGDMILTRELEIAPGERFNSLHDRVADLGAAALIEALKMIEEGSAAHTKQDHNTASYSPMVNKNDAHINWHLGYNKIYNMIRAYDPWPGPYAIYKGAPIKIWDAAASEPCGAPTKPGTIMRIDKKQGLLVACGDGGMWITELQAPNKRRMKTADFLRGQGDMFKVGEILK